ncbi:hypothetical protein SDC9_98044 [bioreactor metagenome]|uniref:Uncharacterized protein n=1 Tax=bioreactor metagenome TaxID=1076179 RepID=A0A645AEB2_9ZZZZ
MARVPEPADDLTCLVGGDATGDAEDDPSHDRRSALLVGRLAAGGLAAGQLEALTGVQAVAEVVRPEVALHEVLTERGLLGSGLGLRVDLGELEQALVDLAQRDRQRLLLDLGLDQRTDVLQQPTAQLGVVGVDLASTLRGEQHQAVLRVDPRQEVVDRGVRDSRGRGFSSQDQPSAT